jgi:hypothetical protein
MLPKFARGSACFVETPDVRPQGQQRQEITSFRFLASLDFPTIEPQLVRTLGNRTKQMIGGQNAWAVGYGRDGTWAHDCAVAYSTA